MKKASTFAKVTLFASVLLSAVPLVAQQATAVAQADDQSAVKAAAAELTVVNAGAAYGNLTLPTSLNGATVTWASANEKLVTASGVVTRPKGRDAKVTLHATVTKGTATAAKDIKVRVVKTFEKAADKAYLFVHFTFSDEKIYFSLSKNNNALDWQELNNGKPVFTSTLGTTGLRDPYIVRSPDGDTFYLMATDLKWFSGAKGPDRKRYIQVWESHDLVHWSAQRDALVSPPNVQNTYAPEAVWDESIGAYVVFWTSKLGTNSYYTPMYATTRDFVTFTEAQIWQPDEWRIDATVTKVGDWYYRFTKSIDKVHDNCHDIVEERSQHLRALRDQWETVDYCIGAKAGIPETEAPLVFKSNPGDINGDYYYLWMEKWIPNKTYVALRTKSLETPKWEVAPINFPNPLPKHGVILPITATEAKALATAYPTVKKPKPAVGTATSTTPASSSTNKRYLITEFGAKGDSITINTKAIQACIEQCSVGGGGTVVIPNGVFTSGSIFLKKGVNLLVEKGGKLRASTESADFPQVATRWEGIEQTWIAALVNAIDLQGVEISGEGIIDGSGEVWTQRGIELRKQQAAGTALASMTAYLPRPRLMGIQNCKHVKIKGLRLNNQASWGLFVLYSTDVDIANLHITAAHNIPSSDGIDIDSSKGVHITGTFIDVNDDCISIKSGKDEDGLRVNRPSEDILIEKCHFAYGHGGVAMGSETSGGIRNVEIRDCLIDSQNWAPIRFKTQPSRGGVVENITYRNIKLANTRKAFEFDMAWRMIDSKPAAKVLPVVRNIKIINVSGTADAVGNMSGLEASPIQGVQFSKCSIAAQKGFTIQYANDVDLSGLTVTGVTGEAIIRKGVKVN
jgi:hypothetical protein